MAYVRDEEKGRHKGSSEWQGFLYPWGLAHGFAWVWVRVQHLEPMPNPYPYGGFGGFEGFG